MSESIYILEKKLGMSKKIKGLRFPNNMTITGRSSAIRAAFIKSIIPSKEPTDIEIEECLNFLTHTKNGKYCTYCGEVEATEWDHFRPIVKDKIPTGYATDIYNIVPSCGKCNQSKGSSHWKDWINNPKPQYSPTNRGIKNLDEIISNLEEFDNWSEPRTLRLHEEVLNGNELEEYLDSCEALLESFYGYQKTADALKMKFHPTK